jgi:hypothetical protein
MKEHNERGWGTIVRRLDTMTAPVRNFFPDLLRLVNTQCPADQATTSRKPCGAGLFARAYPALASTCRWSAQTECEHPVVAW